MKKIILTSSILFAGHFFSQIGINTQNPDSSAMLELKSSSKGFLPTRVTLSSSTDSITILNPATGLVVYHTGTGTMPAGLYYNIGTPLSPNWQLGTFSQSEGVKVYKTALQPLVNQPVLSAQDFEFQTVNGPDMYSRPLQIRYVGPGSREYNSFIVEQFLPNNINTSASSGSATNTFSTIAGSTSLGNNNELNIVRIYDAVSKKVYRYEVNLIDVGGITYISQVVEIF